MNSDIPLREASRVFGVELDKLKERIRVAKENGVANFAEMEREQHMRMLTGQRILAPLPSVGRVVMYNAYGTPKGEYKPVPRAAIITQVHEEDNPYCDIGVAVLNPGGIFFNEKIPYGVDTPGCWNWPRYTRAKSMKVRGDYELSPGESFPDRVVLTENARF